MDPRGRGAVPAVLRAHGVWRLTRFRSEPRTVATVSFYALPLHMLGVGLSTFGLAIDSSTRVLGRDGCGDPRAQGATYGSGQRPCR